jgi:hypothetical protein
LLIFLTQDDWNIVYPIFIAMSTSTHWQRILDGKRFIAAPVNYKDVLKIDGTLARLSNAKLAPAERAARAVRAPAGGAGGVGGATPGGGAPP